MKMFFITAGAILFLFAFSLGLDYAIGLKWYSFIEPKKEDARRKVFLQTRSYNESKLQELVKYRLEYLQAKDSSTKEAIASTIRHMFAEFDETKISSSELRDFLKEIKYGL